MGGRGAADDSKVSRKMDYLVRFYGPKGGGRPKGCITEFGTEGIMEFGQNNRILDITR